ncbi:NAD(P)H-dependent glycerol-3-phosphate dehydrogenase [Peptoniphilus sp. GNH]|nr:putative glycerol-3-phosphate dehydrogenase [NAD(P)+ ] [Clostridiales bacterium KA00134]UHR03111.1 NAD(P)H-dependent glycerol-3-phosphate dehydrogenase [Peptoniphilus sp. GNH]
MKDICLLGGGSWGTAIARLLANKNQDLDFYVRDKKLADEIIEKNENIKYLPGVKLPSNMSPSSDLEKVVKDKRYIIFAVPTNSISELAKSIKPYVDKNAIIINLAKGIEMKSHERPSEIIEEFMDNRFVALSGPSHAEEVARDLPTAVVAASKDIKAAEQVQDLFSTDNFRVYTNIDLVGVEIGGALKNIIALAAGMNDGLGYGDNTKAMLMTRGSYEMSKLGICFGANPHTFNGLTGIGDLIVTCTSMHSRNRRCGIYIGEGMSVEDAITKVGMVVEGIKTTKACYEISQELGVEMPITEKLYHVLYEGTDVRQAVLDLMRRDKKEEIEDIFK